jgi:hypothetical protein
MIVSKHSPPYPSPAPSPPPPQVVEPEIWHSHPPPPPPSDQWFETRNWFARENGPPLWLDLVIFWLHPSTRAETDNRVSLIQVFF